MTHRRTAVPTLASFLRPFPLPPFLLLLLLSLGLSPRSAAGDWPQFRGPNRDGVSSETGLLRTWPAEGPRVLWRTEVCEGYAGAAIVGDRVFFHDYDKDANQWKVRCLSLEKGEPLWTYVDEKKIRPNHGITRSVPAANARFVFSLDPKCVLHCLDATSGEQRWSKELVHDYGTRIPAWYNGQCPLLEDGRVVIAVGGTEFLVVALDEATGDVLWSTPNPEQWPLSHASLMPAELGGVRQYLYCTLQGPLGLSAKDGSLLWSMPFKFNVAVAPSPLAVDAERVFVTAGYDAGSAMLRVRKDAAGFHPEQLYAMTSADWNSEVHTPIVHDGHLFAVGKKRRGLFTCLKPEGEIVWESEASFGLGSFLLADGMFFVLDGDSGLLRLIEASTTGYHELAQAQVLSGNDVWAPMALSRGRLVLRDMAQMLCLEVGANVGGSQP